MYAKEGNADSPRYRWIVRRSAPILVVSLTLLIGCCADVPHAPRPTIEELMLEAIVEGEVNRQGQRTAIEMGKAATAPQEVLIEGPVLAEPIPMQPSAAESLGGPTESIDPEVSDRYDPFENDSEGPKGARRANAKATSSGPKQRPMKDSSLRLVQAEMEIVSPPVADDDLEQEDELLINEEFFEIDVREAISILATEAQADVLIDDKVRGVVNVTIQDATLDKALEKVLLPLGFVVGRRGEQYVICPPDPKSPLFPYVSTQIEYRPRYLDAEDLLTAPPAQMARFVRVMENANVLVIEAPTQFAGMILQRIESLDQPVPQVELEAIVCVVSPDSGFRFGLDWSHTAAVGGETALEAGVTGLGISGTISQGGLKNAFDNFATTSAFVKLLAENGYLSIRAAPRVMAQDGEKANITIGRETFFAIQPTGSSGDNSAFFFQQDIQKVEAGISLELTPYVRERDVTVQIERAEVSEDIRSSTTDLALNPFPIINRRSVSTTVHVEDGKTIIIGGLVQRETIDRVNRVPGLSRLPGVGYLFRSVEQQSREAEVVIFISPRIVRPPCCEPGASDETGPRSGPLVPLHEMPP